MSHRINEAVGLGMHPAILHPRRSQVAPKVVRRAPDSGTTRKPLLNSTIRSAPAASSMAAAGSPAVVPGAHFCAPFLDAVGEGPDNAWKSSSRYKQ
jgi:hypothetical protein